jgi:hypothetical protein
VVASRPPSPREETEAPVEPDIIRELSEGVTAVQNNVVPSYGDSLLSYEGEMPNLEKEEPWTTVRRRRAHSLSSLDKARNMRRKVTLKEKGLTKEQVQTVDAASNNLTADQREILHRRQKKVPIERDGSTSQEEGASKNKGKGIDPREWGNVNISRESLDLEAQAAALDSIAQRKMDNQRMENVP